MREGERNLRAYQITATLGLLLSILLAVLLSAGALAAEGTDGSTGDTPSARVGLAHAVLIRSGSGVQVTLTAEVLNDTEEAVPFVVPLPESYTELTLGGGEKAPAGLTAWEVPDGVPPGRTAVHLSYAIGHEIWEKGLPLEFSLPVDTFYLLLSEGQINLVAPAMVDVGVIEIAGRTLQGYGVQGLAAGQPLTLVIGPGTPGSQIGGSPSEGEAIGSVPTGTTSAAASTSALDPRWVAGAVVLVVFFLLVLSRQRRQGRDHPANLAAERTKLLDRLARLENERQEDRLAPEDYEEQRQVLHDRLVQVTLALKQRGA